MKGIGGTMESRIVGPNTRNVGMATGGFRPNAASNPDPAFFRGTLKGMFQVVYAATGLYTVSFIPEGFRFEPGNFPSIFVKGTKADNTGTNRFQADRQGDWNNTTRSFVISAVQEAAAFAVPSNADNWIDFFMFWPR